MNAPDAETQLRAHQLFDQSQRESNIATDRVFAVLMIFQWIAALAAAFFLSPRTWTADHPSVHPHIWWAMGLGGLLSSFPVALAVFRPGSELTRLTVAFAQAAYSGLLIHLTGGRIETHFHVFGSLAFLAAYRDLRVIGIATGVVAVDHFVRGVWFPASVFGVDSTSNYRWLEHAGWVVFEDVFLVVVIQRGVRDARLSALRHATIEHSHSQIESQVRARTSELVEANRKANEALQAKTDFLRNMSHEIRTPMNAILGFAEHLSEGSLPPASREDAVSAIHRNGAHLLGLINNILDVSTFQAGTLTVDRSPTDAARLVREVCVLLQPQAEQQRLTLTCKVVEPFPRTVNTDPVRLRQILLGLIGNAIKFTQRGSVTVTAACITAENGVPRLRIDVADTGIGMTPEQTDGIFLPFSQADASTTRTYGGAGLGLTVALGLARALSGGITVESTSGKGSTFTVNIDAGSVDFGATKAPAAPTPATAPTPRLDGLRILLAEDGPDNQRLIRHHLTKAGASVIVAGNGRLALEAVGRSVQPFDIILMDMQMPQLDGYNATMLLRTTGARCPLSRLPLTP
ncbi:MAG: ATP-binding protein [Phycisphaerales bacterium]